MPEDILISEQLTTLRICRSILGVYVSTRVASALDCRLVLTSKMPSISRDAWMPGAYSDKGEKLDIRIQQLTRRAARDGQN